MESNHRRRLLVKLIATLTVLGCLVFLLTRRDRTDVVQDVAPTETGELNQEQENAASSVRESSMEEVLDLARKSLEAMQTTLVDYTARFVKQERNENTGVLNPKSEIELKIQTRFRNESNDAPMRIYLKFLSPEDKAGREVIWGADLYNGKMAVHETTMLLSWKTLWLDPTGIIAMTGQKHPIYEIGLIRLVEKLIERGKKDLNNPDVTVTITSGYEFDGVACDLIQAQRSRPGTGKDNFRLAEIIYDPQRMLVLSYRSFGWPKEGSPDVISELPLLESYQYRSLRTNVGLTEADFDVSNEAYAYPK
jgi:hypothetical protein